MATEHPTVVAGHLQGWRSLCLNDAGWSSLVAREAHNLEVVGSNPAPANFFDGTCRQKNRAVDGRKLRVEDSKLSPIYCGLLSTFSSLKRFERPYPMAFAFEKLVVYQKAVDFADQVCLRSENFTRGYGFLADQLNRASVSISANIAEGNGRFTKPDRKNFFGIARGSVQECVPLLELARRRGLVTADDHEALKSQLEEIARMLSGLINGIDNRDE